MSKYSEQLEGGTQETETNLKPSSSTDPDSLNYNLSMGYTNETVTGGCISLFIYIVLLTNLTYRFYMIYGEREHEFNSNEIFYSED